MARARERAEWARCSAVVAMVFNTTRTKRADCKPASHFNPLAERAARPQPIATMTPRQMKPIFLKLGFRDAKPQPPQPAERG